MKRKHIEIIVAVGVLCLLAILVAYHFARASFTDKNSNDPNWANTHIAFDTEEEAVIALGDDLYIHEFSAFIQETVVGNRQLSYELEFREDGKTDDRTTWTMFAMEVLSKSENWAFYIFFDSNDTRLDTFTTTLTYETSINSTSIYYYPNDKGSTFEAATFKKPGMAIYISCNHHNPISEPGNKVLSCTASLLGGDC